MLAFMDAWRRVQGDALERLGFGPTECGYHVIASGRRWRLRDYGARDARPCLLIVAAPIKRPYLWDLAPPVSAVRYCLRHGLRVYLLEWTPPRHGGGNAGLAEYAGRAIGEAVANISRETGTRPFLIGHSLGGTFAAIFSAFDPSIVQGLVLLGAPLCFHPGTSRLRDAMVAMAPPASANVKRQIDEYIARARIDAPAAEPDPAEIVAARLPKPPIRSLDLAGCGITTVIWCTGFQGDFSWVRLPGVLDAWGQPVHEDGVAALPGIYFAGMDFASTRKSGTILAIAEEAPRLVEHIAGRR
jgi:pimeloyl-ACP methyl ester carboxylesterase